jgi:hypothetical protein
MDYGKAALERIEELEESLSSSPSEGNGYYFIDRAFTLVAGEKKILWRLKGKGKVMFLLNLETTPRVSITLFAGETKVSKKTGSGQFFFVLDMTGTNEISVVAEETTQFIRGELFLIGDGKPENDEAVPMAADFFSGKAAFVLEIDNEIRFFVAEEGQDFEFYDYIIAGFGDRADLTGIIYRDEICFLVSFRHLDGSFYRTIINVRTGKIVHCSFLAEAEEVSVSRSSGQESGLVWAMVKDGNALAGITAEADMVFSGGFELGKANKVRLVKAEIPTGVIISYGEKNTIKLAEKEKVGAQSLRILAEIKEN